MDVIKVAGLHKRYGEVIAVHDVGFTVARGEVFGILGRNGAGKTTVVECVSGLRAPDRGRIDVLGLDPRRDRKRLRQVLGVQLQEAVLPDALRVGEAVALYRSFYRDGADPDRLLADLGLTEQKRTPFGALSGGQAQRVSIALALVGNPRVAVLDELSTGLDPRARREIWALVERIRDSGVTVVLVTHVMAEAERLCDRIAVLDAGRVLALDTPTGLVERAGLGQRVRLRPLAPFEHALLADLPGVTGVVADGAEVVVTGTGDLLAEVSSALARYGIAATGTRLERPGLEDAFLELTGRGAAEVA
ncbi:ABC transporter ATP-binding protein [Saccharopolyspora sp. CA-218241]|uniref:ABC transporter ATP-binding protein n=1 Tax=Saccharopolyspora sp. CA-218241 TaxID=3240027 RepID=UPI003D98B68B